MFHMMPVGRGHDGESQALTSFKFKVILWNDF